MERDGMTPEQLLQTKLSIPQRRPVVVSRPQLIELLNAGIKGKLILISAPAGFGKTTLVIEWVSGIGQSAGWVSLDERDNDPVLAIEYFIAALRKIQPDIGETALTMLRSSQNLPMVNILTDLINEIYTLSRQFILVIDDYHVIHNTEIHNALAFLLNNLPPNLHLVILTRADPPIPLAHLRGRGQLTELRAADLRFTIDEVTRFLKHVMDLNLTPEEISSLDTLSEGWVAGLQMAAISLKGRKDPSDFIRSLNMSNRDILDYLFEEVYESQPEDIQSFLLETAILGQLTGPLCNAVTDRSDSGAILKRMIKANLFILPLDEEGRWYRYHRLFADLLLHNLVNSQPERLPVLHGRASGWYERNGLISLAIEHAISGKDYTRAAGLMEQYAEKTLMRGEFTNFIKWVDSLPEINTLANPVLIIFRVLAGLLLGGTQEEKEQAWLHEVARRDAQGRLAGPVMLVQAVAACGQGDVQRSAELAHQALGVLPPESSFWRGLAISCLGQFSLLRGNVPSVPVAIRLYKEAVSTGGKTGNLFTTVLALRRLAEMNIAGGYLHEARICYRKIVDVAVDKQGQPLPLASFGFVGLGKLECEWYHLEEAAVLLEQGIHLGAGQLGLWQLEGYVNLARTRQEQGDAVRAGEAISKARQIVNEFQDTGDYAAFVVVNETRLSLIQGNLEPAFRWVQERGLDKIACPELTDENSPKTIAGHYICELEQTALARLYLSKRSP